MGGMAETAAVVLLLVLSIHSGVCDYDLDYYPEPNFELEFLSGADSSHIDHDHELDHLPDHDHDHETDHDPEPSHDHETALPAHLDVPHLEQVRDKWERRLGGTVEGGYTVLEPDGTVHHVTYTENKKGAGEGATGGSGNLRR